MKYSLIIVQCGFPENWVCDVEQQTSHLLSKQNIVVAFFPRYGITIKTLLFGKRKLISKTSDTLYHFYPLFIFPFARFPLIQALNAHTSLIQLKLWLRWKHLDGDRPKILWIFPYQLTPLPRFYGKGWLTVYDRVDIPDPDKTIDEKRVITHSNIVFAPSGELLQNIPASHNNVPHYITPLGFDKKSFTDTLTMPGGAAHIPKPWIIYAGTIGERLDYRYIFTLVHELPNISFIFIGPILHGEGQAIKTLRDNQNTLFRIPNVFHISKVSRKLVAAMLKQARIGIIPYDISLPINRMCYPMKLMDYLYAGLPIVATSINILTRFPRIYTEDNPVHAAIKIHTILRSGNQPEYAAWAKKFANMNTWQKKINFETAVIQKYVEI